MLLQTYTLAILALSVIVVRKLQVELGINQKQKRIITTDAYPDKKYKGIIEAYSK